jgi:periplasmic protein TonB
MEAKKNPAQDVHRQSLRFFLLGLAVSVSIAIVAFEWTTEKIPYVAYHDDSPLESYIEVLPNNVELLRKQTMSERKIQPRLINLTLTTQPDDPADEKSIIDRQDDPPTISDIEINLNNLPEDDSTQTFTFSEVPPKPIGDYEQFYLQLSKTLQYPRQAIRHGVDGKVFVEFIVNRQGQLSNLKVIKGIGSGCDEEAMRVLALTHWAAGRQRGRPVNVRMIIPITFKIQ